MTRTISHVAAVLGLAVMLPLPLPAQPPEKDPPGLLKVLAAPAFRHSGAIRSMVVLDGGKRIITSGTEGVILWDLATGQRLKKITDGGDRGLALSRAGD